MALPEEWKEKIPESGYEARFSACGICTLMRELGLVELIPAMCRLDYTMSEAEYEKLQLYYIKRKTGTKK